MSRRWGAVAAVLGAAVLSGCVTPATGSDSYRDKAVTSVRAATSAVATAQVAVRLQLKGRIFQPYADETVTASETSLGSIANTFGSVQPPAADDVLRDRITSLLSDAEDAVAAARIATRRSDLAGLAKARSELRGVASDLSEAEAKLS